METQYICSQLITVADFFCVDLLLTLLEHYTIDFCKGTTFDLLILYFEYFGQSPIANNYISSVSLYRLDFVFKLILDVKLISIRFSKMLKGTNENVFI